MKSWLVVALLCLFTVSCSATTRSSLARLSRSRTQAQVEAELASSERLRDRVERTEEDPSSSAPSVHSTVTSSVGPDGAEQKTIDTGDEGGSTTVVLSNQNSVGVLEDETRALLAAKEQHQKSVQEQRRKDEIAHQIRQRTEAGRKLNAKIDEEAKKTEAKSLEKELSDVRSHIAQMASQRAGQALGGEQSEKSSTSSSEQDSKSSASEALKQLRSSAAAAEAAKIAKEEEDAKYVIQAGVFVPRQNTVLAGADAIRAADSYSYAFWIKPDGKAAADSTKWSNIFAKGRNDNQRNPAVFLWPASTKLHIRSGSSADPTVGCDPETNLIADKWTHVVISHAVNNLQVFFNGESVCQNTKTDSPAFNDGNLWASSPWFEPAPVSLADFRFYPRVISQSEMGALVSAKKFK